MKLKYGNLKCDDLQTMHPKFSQISRCEKSRIHLPVFLIVFKSLGVSQITRSLCAGYNFLSYEMSKNSILELIWTLVGINTMCVFAGMDSNPTTCKCLCDLSPLMDSSE